MTAPHAPASEDAAPDEPLPHYPFSTRGDRLAPELTELRGRCPVARVGTNSGDQAWLVTGYELTQHVLRDRAFARSVLAEADSPGQDAPILAPELLDAMNHLQKAGLRDEVLKALGRNQPELPADWVEAVTREGLDAMVREGGPGDLQRHFAEWVAGQCMCRLLGLPFEDHAWLAVRADLDLTMVTPTHEELARNWEEIRVYMHEHMAARRPGEPRGLADRLADLNAAHQGLTDRQLSNIVAVLFVSGYEDFASFLGVAAFNLLQRPDVMDAVRARPETMPQCVEELLRCSVVLGNAIPRFVTRDARLGSAHVKEGDMILLSLDAVNYDPDAFSDAETFDPTRSPNPHLRFGYGRHHCPGAHLVRRQSDAAFRVLLDRLPGIRLAVPPAEVPWHPNRMAIMAAGIPVTW
ncbi:cytochrome P450 [Streptomyces griseocarneus]|uniref:cytochrome P450 n=1 Tax=Streptomyces griseocarneus TaxID=51201 RepID=UPI00167CC4D9|nr:cytochrome P450 [Streptomyces griseocarneus]MBZ6475498.1 cytochrome P450 [Streptomyces griseocarneus]GHG75631.1 cytochrome P450 [Streptomyces griseocarneus]